MSATISAEPMEGQQPQPVQDLDQVLGRIQDIECTQLNAFKMEIRDDQEEALSGNVKKLEASRRVRSFFGGGCTLSLSGPHVSSPF